LLAQGAPEPQGVLAMHLAEVALEVRESRVKDFIIIFLIIVLLTPV
jgi:hypothetical protein